MAPFFLEDNLVFCENQHFPLLSFESILFKSVSVPKKKTDQNHQPRSAVKFHTCDVVHLS